MSVNSSRRRAYLMTLRRRRDFLAEKVAEDRCGNRRTDLSYMKAEISALNWALQVCEAARREDVLTDLERIVVIR